MSFHNKHTDKPSKVPLFFEASVQTNPAKYYLFSWQTCRQTQQSTTFFHGKRAVKFNTGGLSHSLKSYSGICLKPDYSRTPLKRNWPSQLFYPVSGRDCFKPIIWRSMFWDGLLLSHPTRKRVFLLVLYMWCVLTWPMPFIWHALQNFFWLILKK